MKNEQKAKIWYDKGIHLQLFNRSYEKAILCFDEALKLNPRYIDAWASKSDCLYKIDCFAEAINCLDKLLELAPHSIMHTLNGWYTKGNCEEALGRRQDAIRSYRQYLSLVPVKNPYFKNQFEDVRGLICRLEISISTGKIIPKENTWDNKGYGYISQFRYKEAITCFDQALKLDPLDIYAWINKGKSLRCLERYEEAINCYNNALKLNPLDADAWSGKGSNLLNLGRNDDAVRCYNRSLELNPCDGVAWMNKASGEEKLGRRQDAVQSYHQVLIYVSTQDTELIEFARKRLKDLEDA